MEANTQRLSSSESGRSDIEVSINIPEEVLKLHLAEYQTLSARCTNLITIQYAMISVALVFLGLIAQMWRVSNNHGLLLWGSIVVLQVIAVIRVQAMSDFLTILLYMEKRLRPLITKHIGSEPFWDYEYYLADLRSEHKLWQWNPQTQPERLTQMTDALLFYWSEWISIPIIAVGIICVGVVRSPFLLGDWGGLTLNVVLLVIQGRMVLGLGRIRRDTLTPVEKSSSVG